MLVSEFIEEMKRFLEKHGDIPVDTYGFDGRFEHRGPTLSYRKILKGRERRDEFCRLHDDQDRKGDPVCRI